MNSLLLLKLPPTLVQSSLVIFCLNQLLLWWLPNGGFLVPSFLLFTGWLSAVGKSCPPLPGGQLRAGGWGELGEVGQGAQGPGEAMRPSPGLFFQTSAENKLAVKLIAMRSMSRQAGLGPGPLLVSHSLVTWQLRTGVPRVGMGRQGLGSSLLLFAFKLSTPHVLGIYLIFI